MILAFFVALLGVAVLAGFHHAAARE